jgi:hypothetical protein
MIAMAVKEHIRRANVKRMRRRILRQIIRIFRGKEVEREYLTFLSMALTIPNVLSDYDKALEEIRDEIENGNFYVVDFDERTRVWMRLHDTVEKPDETVEAKSRVRMILRPKRSAMKPLHKAIARYCFERQIEYTASTITSLTNAYRKKDEILQTYYAAFLRKYGYLRYSAPPMLIANMKDLVEDGGVFACEHVLQAVYTSKDEKLVFDILKVLDKKETFVHPKMVSDGLLAFQGNAEALQALLLEHRKEFSIDMQVNILTYLRFASGAHCEKIFDILDNRKENDEIRFACMRYFGKHRYEKAFRLLADFAKNERSERIEYSIVALTALRNYPSKKTFEILQNKIHSPHWFVRYNAAESLEVLGIRYEELVEVFDGEDRFAREMLQYQFDQRYAENKERGL